MRGENLVRRNGFEVLEVLTGRGVIGGVCTSNTSNSLRHTRFSPRVSPAPLPPYSTPSPSLLSLEAPPPPTTTLLPNNTSPPTTNPHIPTIRTATSSNSQRDNLPPARCVSIPNNTTTSTSSTIQYNTRRRASDFFNTSAALPPSSSPPSNPNTEDNITLFQLLIDPVFDSIRPFTRKIIAANKRRFNEVVSDSQPSTCTICKQSFQRLQQHQNNSTTPNGCLNMARLRHYICLRKNISFIPPPQIGNLTISELEQHLVSLN